MKRRFVELFKLLALVSLTAYLSSSDLTKAQNSSKAIEITDQNGQSVVLYEQSHALIIWVSDYEHWGDLEAVPKGAKLLEDALKQRGFNVIVTENPNSQELRASVNRFIGDYGYDENNRLVVFFAGHGATIDETDGYIVPSDAPDPIIDEPGFFRLAISMQDVMAWAGRIRSNHALFLFDSCFSGTLFETKTSPNPNDAYIRTLTGKPVRQFLTAGDAGEEVPAGNDFVRLFIQGLDGEADNNRDGYVTGLEVGAFVQTTLPGLTGNAQSPQYGKMQSTRYRQGDIVFLSLNSEYKQPRKPENVRGDIGIIGGEREEVWYQIEGNAEDVNYRLKGPAYYLGGGGADVDRGIQWMIDQVRGCKDCSQTVDLVVLRSLNGYDQEAWDLNEEQPNIEENYLGYHELLSILQGVDSIETFVFSNSASLGDNQPDTFESIANAEVVFFAGGDQCKYARNIKGTAIEDAIKSVHARGGAIGGTSSGSMIQGEWIFNACSDTVTSDSALEDPYEDILFTGNLFQWLALKGTVVDTHFYQRDRMGRGMAFLARLIRDKTTDQPPLTIGIDEDTSLVINQQGIAQVMNDNEDGSVYFILADHQPEICEPKTPLSFSNYKVWQVRDGETFNLQNIPKTGYYQVNVDRGQIVPDNPYSDNSEKDKKTELNVR